MVDEERGEDEAPEDGGGVEETPSWGTGSEVPTGNVQIETGRGQATEVAVGAPFQETIERIANDANYGGYFRVFLQGEELLDPNESPETIETGMRIAITSYDKVGM